MKRPKVLALLVALLTALALAAGYDAHLPKPVEPVSLLATVARLAQTGCG